jgi:hypothetical protein
LHVVLGSAVVGAELELGRAAACGIGGFERGGFFYDTTLHAGPTRNDQSQRIVGVAAAGHLCDWSRLWTESNHCVGDV